MLGLKRDLTLAVNYLFHPSAQHEARKETLFLASVRGASPRKCALKTLIRLNSAAELHGELLWRLIELN